MRRRRVVILALVALVIAAVWLARRAGPHVEPGSALVLELEGEYVEAQEVPVFARLLGQRGRPFAGLLSELAKVERDDRIATVVLRLGSLGVGWDKAQELRAAIVDTVSAVLDRHSPVEVATIAEALHHDAWARREAENILAAAPPSR